MSFVTSSRRRALLLLLGLLAGLLVLALAGCGGKKEVDPYVYASLRAVTRGDTLSPGFLFEIDAPEFDYVKGDIAVVRDGNLLEFLVGKDLERNHASYAGALLGVQKMFSPTTHLVIQRVKRGGVIDSLEVAQGYHLPRILPASQVDLETPGAPLPDLDWKKLDLIKNYLPKEEGGALIAVQSIISNPVHAPRHTLTPEQRAAAGPRDHAWYAVFPNATFEVIELPEGAAWMIEMLRSKGLPIIGSFSLTEVVENYADRKVVHPGLGNVVGKMQINWFKYGNTFIKGHID